MSPALGLAAAASAHILGAAAVLIGDMNQERLAHATRVAGLTDQPDLSHRLRAETTCRAPTVLLPIGSGAISL